jgi:hypothetical protein
MKRRIFQLAGGLALVSGLLCPGADGQEAGIAGGQMVRGMVTATAKDGFRVKTEDGETFRVVTSVNTKLMMERQPVKLADVKVGSGVGAMGLLDGPTKTMHALMVMVMTPEQTKAAREGLGREYIVGKVTGIAGAALTVQRRDGVVQKIVVDAGAAIRCGGEGMRAAMSGGVVEVPAGGREQAGAKIGLADVRVGDSVGGLGAMVHGVFVARELNVVSTGTQAAGAWAGWSFGNQ